MAGRCVSGCAPYVPRRALALHRPVPAIFCAGPLCAAHIGATAQRAVALSPRIPTHRGNVPERFRAIPVFDVVTSPHDRHRSREREFPAMNASQSLIVAAVSGILLGCGSSTPPAATPAGENDPSAGRVSAPGDRHSCKGRNECAHQGGCKTETHACKGQNDCRSQGGCKGG